MKLTESKLREIIQSEIKSLNEAKKLQTKKLVKLYKGSTTDIDELAEFVYNNYDKVTGYDLSDRDDEGDFPDEVKYFVDEVMGEGSFDELIDEFTEAYGDN